MTLSTSGRSVAAIAADLQGILAGLLPITVHSGLAYSVRLAQANAAASTAVALLNLAPSRIVIITDEHVAGLHLQTFAMGLQTAGFSADQVVTLAAGEARKTLSAVEQVTTALMAAGCDRSSVVVALGGGVVTDIAGFAASIFSRGIRWLAVPTTLLGMVDAAIGGKTAVNFGEGKNLIGTFHHPAAVIVDATFCNTESARAIRSGLAEVVKVAAVYERELFEWLESHAAELVLRDPLALAHAVLGAIKIKAAVVSEDPDERGARKVLNFGHTLGHAIEAASNYATFAHGEAVAVGMVAAAQLGVELGRCQPDVPVRLSALLRALQLPIEMPDSIKETAMSRLRYDKKRQGNSLTLIVPDVIGSAALIPLSGELCEAGFRQVVSRL